jgi:hypothetical protein
MRTYEDKSGSVCRMQRDELVLNQAMLHLKCWFVITLARIFQSWTEKRYAAIKHLMWSVDSSLDTPSAWAADLYIV